jgi:hypothetical protein
MAFAEDHDMINTFPADRSDQPFDVCVLHVLPSLPLTVSRKT